MNNPFSRFKHYRDAEGAHSDPKENHATECLAACLVFSPTVRRAFIQFLFEGHAPFSMTAADEIEVATQVQTDFGGIIDLLLSCEGKFNIVVEVKVGSPEDEDQLKRYRQWLDAKEADTEESKKPKGDLFALVRDANRNLKLQSVTKRHTWRGLYHGCFSKIIKAQADYSEADTRLVKNFMEYLNKEGIVTTFNTLDLKHYDQGLKAQTAIEGVFGRMEDSSILQGITLTKKWIGKLGSWPCLEIGMGKWDQIFGDGYNQKLYLWFTVPGVWDAATHDFYWEIQLWHKGHCNDWNSTIPKLGGWMQKLRKNGFTIEEQDGPQDKFKPAYKIADVPYRIIAYRKSIPTVEISEDVDKLVETLAQGTKEYLSIISSLAD